MWMSSPETVHSATGPVDRTANANMVKLPAMLMVLLSIVFVSTGATIENTLWFDNGQPKDDFTYLVLLPAISLYLMLLCSAVFPRTSPPLGAFDYRCRKVGFADCVGLVFLLFVSVLVQLGHGAIRTVMYPSEGTVTSSLVRRNPTLIALMLVDASFLSPFAEEVFWRGYVQSTLVRTIGPTAGVVVQALLWSIGHPTDWLAKSHLFLLGITYGVWCHRRRTLLPTIVAHSINNIAFHALSLIERSRPF